MLNLLFNCFQPNKHFLSGTEPGSIPGLISMNHVQLLESFDHFCMMSQNILHFGSWLIVFCADVHNTNFSDIFQKTLVCRMVHQKHIFIHWNNHSSSSCLCFSCLVFTIFCADLDRLSWSSRKRLIFRIASWNPGICTFS